MTDDHRSPLVLLATYAVQGGASADDVAHWCAEVCEAEHDEAWLESVRSALLPVEREVRSA